MHVHVFQHVAFEGLGAIGPWLQQAGVTVTFTRFFEQAGLPSPESVDALIVMGGPMSVHDELDFRWLRAEKAFISLMIQRNTPVLGICLGAQLIAEVLGARVSRNREREIGWFPVLRLPDAEIHPLGACFPREAEVFHWHGETFSLPPGAVRLLHSAACDNQAFAFGRSVLGLQFHLETTEESARELIAHASRDLAPGPFVQNKAEMLSATGHFARLTPLLERVLTAMFVRSVATSNR